MGEKKRIAVLGGDERITVLYRTLSERGCICTCWGVPGEKDSGGWEELAGACDILLLPVPATVDGVRVFAPSRPVKDCPRLSALLTLCKVIFGGRLPDTLLHAAAGSGCLCTDYFGLEQLERYNAMLTAEGALRIVMNELPVALHGIGAAVVGYGRIGQLLAEKLCLLGADVTVCARRTEVLTWAQLHGASTFLLDGDAAALGKALAGKRVIFNTVPVWLLTRQVLAQLRRNVLIVDLASAPGGVDRVAAEDLGIRSLWGTALPGKYAPESAGIALADAVTAMTELPPLSHGYLDGKEN